MTASVLRMPRYYLAYELATLMCHRSALEQVRHPAAGPSLESQNLAEEKEK